MDWVFLDWGRVPYRAGVNCWVSQKAENLLTDSDPGFPQEDCAEHREGDK